MDSTILKLDVKSWNESLFYLKGKQDELSVEEWTAIEFLAELWRKRDVLNQDDKDDCQSNIDILVNSDVKHGNNREINQHSKKFRGVAKKCYLGSKEDFMEYKKAFQDFVNTNTPNRSVRTVRMQTPQQQTIVPERQREREQQEVLVPKVETVTFPTGEKYIGTLDSMRNFHGHGRLIYSNGNWCEGEWIRGEMTGHGKKFFTESERLDIGEYKNGDRVGIGRMEWSDGDWAEGPWNNNGINVRGKKYVAAYKRLDEGDFVDHLRDGHGVMKWDNGDRYEGVWKDTDEGLTGFGTYYYANGTSEKGKWISGTWYANGTNANKNETTTTTTTDSGGDSNSVLGCIFVIIAAFIPILGIIVYFCIRKRYSSYANSILGGSIIGFVITGVLAMCR